MAYWDTADPQAPVLVIGTAGVDLIAHPQGELQIWHRIPARVRRAFGGVARNVAENLARLGQPVRFITAVGDEPAGRALLAHLEALGVDTTASLRAPDLETGHYIGLLYPQGGLQYGVYDLRAVDALTPAYLRAQQEMFAGAAWGFVDANVRPQALRTIFSLARQHGVRMAADATSAQLVHRLKPHLARITLLTLNHVEAAALLERPVQQRDVTQALEAARALVAQGVGLALVTLAEFGVCYATEDGQGHIPALRTEVVDPTGAGDALTATVIYGLQQGLEPDEAVRLGTAAAALTLRSQGTVAPDLSLETLYEALGL